MKKKILLLSLLILSGFPCIFGQTVIKNDTLLNAVRDTPREEIFVHYNTSLLFAGEYIYFRIYNINSRTGTLSPISKIAYVELVDEDGQRLFRQKVSLEDGLGQGDFFIPTSAVSGNYKLLAYTQWMLNGGTEEIFRGDLVIINPYLGNQDRVRSEPGDSTEVKDPASNSRLTGVSSENEVIELNINDEVYGNRQKVSLNLQSTGEDSFGTYSVSVRKLGSFEDPSRLTAENYSDIYRGEDDSYRFEDNTIFLPELRGDLIKGKILASGMEESAAVSDLKLAFAIPEDKIIRTSQTDGEGNFIFSIEKDYSGATAFLQVLNETPQAYDFILKEAPSPDYSALEFGNFVIRPEMKEAILRRSVHNQIENSYFGVKADTVKIFELSEPFYGDLGQTYNLDEFDRFPTVRQTFVEIIKSAWLTKDNKGREVFEIKDYQINTGFQGKTMLLVDGLLVEDHERIADFDARKIDKVHIVRNIYYLGPKIFQGIVILQTKEGDFPQSFQSERIERKTINPPQPIKFYYQQTYGSNENFKSRIPDFRRQLLWAPDVSIGEEVVNLDFFTSDIPGTYEIVLEGFTDEGQPVSLRKTFEVE